LKEISKSSLIDQYKQKGRLEKTVNKKILKNIKSMKKEFLKIVFFGRDHIARKKYAKRFIYPDAGP
jgi:hypothetical protein